MSSRDRDEGSCGQRSLAPGAARWRWVWTTLGALGAVAWSPLAAAQTPYAPPPGGELLPPPPPASPESVNTIRQLELADREDSGRGLQYFWIDPEVGIKWVDLALINNADLVDGDDFEGSGLGPSLGVGLGGRLLYFTAGARFRYTMLPEFDVWTVGLEAALRIPRGQWEPYLFAGGGYLRTANIGDDRLDELVISGGYGALGGGVDYFITPVFALGLRGDVELTFVGRDALPSEAPRFYEQDGSGVGLAASAALHLSLHF